MYQNNYKFSKEQLDTARNVDLGEMLLFMDEDRFYVDEHGYVRDTQRPKFKVDRERNKYFLNQEVENAIGNPIEYFDKIQKMGFVKAVENLLSFANGTVVKMPKRDYGETDGLDNEATFAYYSKMAEDYVENEELYEWY